MPGEDLIPLVVGQASPWAIILVILWFGYRQVRTGAYVPRSTVDLLLAQSDKVIAAHEKTIASQEKQINALFEGAQTTKHALESLAEAGAEKSDVAKKE